MNIELLRQVQAKMREHPEHFDMETIFADAYGDEEEPFRNEQELLSDDGCACIAGWAFLLSPPAPDFLEEVMDDWGEAVLGYAAHALGLDWETARTIFYPWNWPEQFKVQYESSETPVAELACERIEHFVVTEGREGDKLSQK